MKKLSLQEIKKIELNLLDTFHAFCVENNIKYYFSHGTLLGAIRYKGFIPWDDDIDLLIPREDYNKLLKIFKDSDKYRLFAFEKDKNYRYPFAKLCDMTTCKKEPNYDNGVELGVDIDLFPLDAWDDDYETAKREVKYIRRNMRCLDMTKLNVADSINPVKRFIKAVVMRFCKIIGSEYFIQNICKVSCQNEQKERKFLGCKVWCVYGEKGIIPAEAFADTMEIEFEGKRYPAPVGYDTYLTCLYGDYLPEPPKEKQKTHHVFEAYKL